MDKKRPEIIHLYDEKGTFIGVQLDAATWLAIKPLIKQHAQTFPPPDALEDFKKFMAAWDFKYDYDASVTCPACHSATRNWQTDKNRPFSLHNANIGGLLVFHCNKCGATIRHKYFRDHMDRECDS